MTTFYLIVAGLLLYAAGFCYGKGLMHARRGERSLAHQGYVLSAFVVLLAMVNVLWLVASVR